MNDAYVARNLECPAAAVDRNPLSHVHLTRTRIRNAGTEQIGSSELPASVSRCHGLILAIELAHCIDRTTPPLSSTPITDALGNKPVPFPIQATQ